MATMGSPSAHASLADWGWDEAWAAAFAPHLPTGLVPARVIAQHRGRWLVADGGESGPLGAGVTGRLRHESPDDQGLPAVGDWVGCLPDPGHGETRIDVVLARRSAFVRRAAGSRVGSQVVAANVDTLLIATSLNQDLNPRRLERYVAMAHESGTTPVVLLTKADLAVDPGPVVGRLGRDLGVPVVTVSARTEGGLDAVAPWIAAGQTLAVVGSSGVGKSTLLNRLAGGELMATREIRDDDARGRHTTSHRELFRLASGALLLDTPGMRELGLWDAAAGVDETFAEIIALAGRCRFRDCGHDREPGCAVRAAIGAGDLDERRLRGYRRLTRELAEQPSPAGRRTAERRFSKAIRRASEDSLARKSDGGRSG